MLGQDATEPEEKRAALIAQIIADNEAKLDSQAPPSRRVEENIGASAIELTPDDLREIDSAASWITVQGGRYPEELERLTYR